MKYAIGLDCGIASVGSAVMELDANDEPARIIKLGSRVFDKAENPQTGASLALPRREARGLRRRLRRHTHRIQRIKSLLVREGVITLEQSDTLFCGKLDDIYMLRTKALDEPLTNLEFARVLIHLAQRRGFRSNRKSDAKDKEAGKLLLAVSDNQILMQEKDYRTVGEMFFKDAVYAENKRNKADEYKATVSRAMVEAEMKLIFKKQREYGVSFAGESLENEYLCIALSQRSFSEGPGEGSPYGGNQVEKMIGKCTLIEGEKRAAKSTYSFQLFNLLQKINHIRLITDAGESTPLNETQRKAVFDLCHKSPSVNYAKIRKELEIPATYKFSSLSYGTNDIEAVEKKAKFDYLKAYHQIRKALDKLKKGYITSLSTAALNDIGYAFNVYKNDSEIKNNLLEKGIEPIVINTLIENLSSFSGFGHISVKACDMLIPFLEKGLTYDKACESAGLDFRAHSGMEKGTLLPANAPELEDITNPVVRRAVSQTIKVVNAIIQEQGGSPAYINIELARELSKTFEERNAITKRQNENHSANEKVIERLKNEFHVFDPTGMDIVKFKLYLEQDGIDPYTQTAIELDRLFDYGYVDVDHIIPYSISFDDSYANKVLTFSAQNRQKGNRLPLQYLSGKSADDFKVWVNNNVKNYNKRKNLLKEKLTEESEFKTRNLNDTKYLSRFLLNYINGYLAFDAYKGRKKHVTAVNGAVTGYMRKRWGITKIREDGDLHHAVDAAVIACITDSLIQRVSKYSKYKELQYSGTVAVDSATGEVVDIFPLPYPCFRKELEIRTMNDPRGMLLKEPLPNYTAEDIERVNPAFVSRMPNHKVTGPAHKETIRSGKKEGVTISKVPLTKLKLDKTGEEIAGYYNKQSDLLLYHALLERLKQFGGNGEKAFENIEFHKPKADGSEGPIVRKVKIEEKSSLNVKARGEQGVADNGSMVRIDVFFVEGEGYYFVPIYVADTVKKELPNRACVQGKTYEEWKEMDESDFLFSLYPNDLIKVTAKKNIKMAVNLKGSSLPKEHFTNDDYFYYVKAGISTASITVENHDGAYIVASLGIKSLLKIEKYQVDAIGNIHRVHREKRMGFVK